MRGTSNNRKLKQPRRQRQQKPHKFAYLTMKNSIFARFARAFFMFWHFADVLVLSTTWNELFCSCVDDVTMWWQMFNFVFLCPKRWFEINSRTVRRHFSSIMALNKWKKNCRKGKLHFQVTFSLPSTSCLLKLPNNKIVTISQNVYFQVTFSLLLPSLLLKLPSIRTQLFVQC